MRTTRCDTLCTRNRDDTIAVNPVIYFKVTDTKDFCPSGERYLIGMAAGCVEGS